MQDVSLCAPLPCTWKEAWPGLPEQAFSTGTARRKPPGQPQPFMRPRPQSVLWPQLPPAELCTGVVGALQLLAGHCNHLYFSQSLVCASSQGDRSGCWHDALCSASLAVPSLGRNAVPGSALVLRWDSFGPIHLNPVSIPAP